MFMKKMTCFLLTLIYLLAVQLLHAQPEGDATPEEKLQFKLGTFYNSNLNYYGRTDSLRSSGFFPLAEIWFSKSVYINAAPVFTSNAAGHFEYAGTVATAGYQLKSRNEKFFTHIFFTKPIYKSGSQLVQSALKEQLSGTFSWQNKYLGFTIGGDLKHSDKIDYGLNAGADHIFKHEFPEQFVLVVDPSAYIYTGTQQFTKTYYEKKNLLVLPGTDQAVTKQVNKLNILSYELTAPVILAHNNWQVLLIPAYVIPRNLVIVENRPDLSERGKEMFYVTAGAKIIF
jgi:hypothetical protein